MTSFAFMFDEVPEPVWKTSIGNWSSSSPAAIRSAAAAIRSALSGSSSPRSAFTRAAAALMRPSQCATGAGIGSPETGKFSTALRVSPPQSSSAVRWPLVADVGARLRASLREQLVPARELDPWTAVRLTAAALMLVDRLPARVLDELDPAIEKHALERRPVVVPGDEPGAGVVEQPLARLDGVLPVRPDHAARAALDPAGAVDAAHDLAVLPDDTALHVRHHAPGLVERQPGQRDAAVADAAEDDPARDHLGPFGRDRADLSVIALTELVVHDLDRLDPPLAEDRHRRDEEAEAKRLRLSGRLTGGELTEDVDVSPRAGAVGLERGGTRRVELELRGV